MYRKAFLSGRYYLCVTIIIIMLAAACKLARKRRPFEEFTASLYA
jgi:hypothetical protein